MTVRANAKQEASGEATPKRDWWASLLGRGAARLLRALALTWRSDARQLGMVDEQLAAGVPVIAVFWHGSYLALFALAAGRPVTVFTSHSFRGKVIASICQAFGYQPSLLPPGRLGYAHMRSMLSVRRRKGAKATLVAIAVDGPLGPRHEVKLGALHMAAHLGAVLMPIRVTSKPAWIFANRWDRFSLPLPLARVKLDVGSPIFVPKDFGSNHDEIVELRNAVQAQLNGEAVSSAQH